MIEVSKFDALYIYVILTCRPEIFVVLWLILWLQVAKVGFLIKKVFKTEYLNLLGYISIKLSPRIKLF